MERVVVTHTVMGPCAMQVCAVNDATDREILDTANQKNPVDLPRGWCLVARDGGKPDSPVACPEDKGRTHFVLFC